MTWLVWIATVLASILALLLLLIVALLASSLRLRGSVDERGLAGGLSWFGVAVDVDGRARWFEVRLLGWRVARRPLRRGADDVAAIGPTAEASAEASAETTAETSAEAAGTEQGREDRRRGRRLSVGSFRRLARAGLGEARRVVRLVHVERLRVEAVVASDDPALTGELYGYGCALAAVIRSAWPEAELDLGVDFVETRPRGRADAAVRLRPIRLSGSALRMGLLYLRERRRGRRLARAPTHAAKRRTECWRRSFWTD